MKLRMRTGAAALAVLALTLTACGSSGDDNDNDNDTGSNDTDVDAGDNNDADDGDADDGDAAGSALDDLIAAAQDEGSLTFYGAPDARVLNILGDAFEEKYDIPVEAVRLVTGDLTQRFAAEAEAGAPVADLIIVTHSPFFDEALSNDWLVSLDEAGIPDYPGDFPTDYFENDGATAIISMVPTSLVYNTDAFDEAPEGWEIYADPSMQGEIQMADPATSPANLAFWTLMQNEYGDEFLEAVAANNPTWHNSAVPATQGVAAGEGSLSHPGVTAIVRSLQAEGAPVEVVNIGPTTGPEMALGLTNGSASPNAAKLFAHFMLSEEGNNLLAEESEAASPYGLNQPEGWTRPGDIDLSTGEEISALLGAN